MKLVATADYGVRGVNHYWDRRDFYGISEQELSEVGVHNYKAYVDKSLIPHLNKANEIIKQKGYELIVKDAYRSPELYRLIRDKRYIMFSKEQTDKILNLIDMPHSNGRTVDVSLVDTKTGDEIPMRNKKDDPHNFFINYYRDRKDAESL